jgi:hypothetical protein
MTSTTDLPTVTSLDELTKITREHGDALYLRWSRGPDVDADTTSRDELTGVELPGLCANPMAMEPWWADRPQELWVARRVYDYRHLQDQHGPDVRPWLLLGKEIGRGPDNEPLVVMDEPVAWVAEDVVAQCEELVTGEDAHGVWGSLRRHD